ncbi:MAG: hypothetical protein JXA42_21805 [Anaerolineales bacterium]|nr:hypothetical protein [Anaerolineales bacterium]
MDLQAMDLAEVRNLVKWLDEQQRKGRQELAVVQQQLNNNQLLLSEMSTRIQELEGQVTSSQTRISRLSQVDQQMANLKAEIVHLIEQQDDRRIQSEREMERLRLVEHEAIKRAIDEFQPIIPSVSRLAEQMENRRAEDERLSNVVGILQNQIPPLEARLDERVRDVAYLEENQRQNVRRIAEFQQGLIDSKKREDALQTKNLTFEDILRRNMAAIDELMQAEVNRKQKAQEFIEQGNLAEQRRKQQLDRWQTELGEFSELMAGYARQWRVFEEQHRASREATAGLLEFKTGLEQRQQEVMELQRVNAERMKNQWAEFLTEDDKRQKQRRLEAEQWNAEQKRQREDFDMRFRELKELLDSSSNEVKRLFELQEKYADAYRQFSRIWLEGYESVVSPPITRKIPG